MGIWQPQSFQILLRSPADLTIIQPAAVVDTPAHHSFSGRHHWRIVAGERRDDAAGPATRSTSKNASALMAEAEFTAILSERNRLAREIHDTLAQGLVATSVQLRLAKKQAAGAPDSLHQNLDTAQQLVRSSLEEARNSIWNMRSQVLETGDLAAALKNILQQMADGTETETRFDVAGRPRRLAPMVESNLLRVGQEAITNATKHAQARQIKVKLEFGEKHFRLVVTDDGRGFEPASPSRESGGFGLVGMRERAAELNGELNIRSATGQGAEVNLRLPLSGE